ncbi:hypothetical protein [Paracoccus aerius]|uniref:Uncharacterized protein n=1 Tax=Paracoccus aerius TaxID=1915382 RepID=A0ABS1SAT7_9RHOB|nr:hypothetical protein [Paracoccus aerius]MBL3675861.1 hypothetical protein [Paracoccus aerius]GHG38358.1 hypothetical protein GCM10017322_40970 [Paracoccus aerius]
MTRNTDRHVREGYGTLFEAVLQACVEAGLKAEAATAIAVRTVEIVQAGNMTPWQDDHPA